MNATSTIFIGNYKFVEDLVEDKPILIYTDINGEYVFRGLLTDDELLLTLYTEMIKVKEELSLAKSLMTDARSLLQDVHGYNSEVYREMGVFLYGDEEDDYDDEEAEIFGF